MKSACLCIAFLSTATLASDVILATFGDEKTSRSFREMNDPVMGGQSSGTFHNADGMGVFDGEVRIVPKLSAPGFIQAVAEGSYPDISHCKAIAIMARAKYKYDGYRFQFGTKKPLFGCSFFSGGFKAHFDAPVSDTFQKVVIPFGDFSDCNSDSTGEPKRMCSKDKSVCPDMKTLRDVERLAIWGEGAAGQVHLEIKSIAGTDCGSSQSLRTFKPSEEPLASWSTLKKLFSEFMEKGSDACDKECKQTCCRNGGGKACVTGCGCKMPCMEKGADACDKECKQICCLNGGGKACVTACGCKMPC